MKPETKSLLDRYQKLNRQDFHSETRIDFMRVCDVEELIEELTKWNKVEDGLPDERKVLLLKIDSELVIGFYEATYFRSYPDYFPLLHTPTEWKYIN